MFGFLVVKTGVKTFPPKPSFMRRVYPITGISVSETVSHSRVNAVSVDCESIYLTWAALGGLELTAAFSSSDQSD